MEKFWKSALAVGGVATVGAFVFWSLYKEWLSLPIFSKIPPNETFEIMRLFLFLTFLSLLILVVAYFRRDNNLSTERGAISKQREDVEQLEQLFQTAAYNADILAKGGQIDETLHVQRFKDASSKMHEIATLLLERNGPDSPIGVAVAAFYNAFREKESLTVCRARMDNLKRLV